MAEFLGAAHIIVPLVLGAALVLYVAQKRVLDGVDPLRLPLDRDFQITFFYTGSLLAIYLSCVHFVSLALRHSP